MFDALAIILGIALVVAAFCHEPVEVSDGTLFGPDHQGDATRSK